jgi:hypothetical protein
MKQQEFNQMFGDKIFSQMEKMIAKEVDIIHGRGNMRQRAYFAIWRRVIEQCAEKEQVINHLEKEANQREDSLNRYMDYQARPCPTCKKMECIEHCNFCGDAITYKKDDNLFLMNKKEWHDWRLGKLAPGKKPKHYPANLNHSPHLLCNFKNNKDYRQMVVAEERRLDLAWLEGTANGTKPKDAKQIARDNARVFI